MHTRAHTHTHTRVKLNYSHFAVTHVQDRINIPYLGRFSSRDLSDGSFWTGRAWPVGSGPAPEAAALLTHALKSPSGV